MTYVVKDQGNRYVQNFSHEGIPCRAVPTWTVQQGLAFRWDDRNGAASVAADASGRVVRLVPKINLTPTIEERLEFGRSPIAGIKMYRARTGSTLRDAKDTCCSTAPIVRQRPKETPCT